MPELPLPRNELLTNTAAPDAPRRTRSVCVGIGRRRASHHPARPRICRLATRFVGLCRAVRGASVIGATGFEPATFRPPVECATKLRHAPVGWKIASRATGRRAAAGGRWTAGYRARRRRRPGALTTVDSHRGRATPAGACKQVSHTRPRGAPAQGRAVNGAPWRTLGCCACAAPPPTRPCPCSSGPRRPPCERPRRAPSSTCWH